MSYTPKITDTYIRIEFVIQYLKKNSEIWNNIVNPQEGTEKVQGKLKTDFANWVRSQNINIFEFLFLDNITLEVDLSNFANLLEVNINTHRHHAMQLKARFVIDKLKLEYNLGEIKAKILFYRSFEGGGRSRCSKYFNFGTLNLSCQKTMLVYSARMKRSYDEELNNHYIA